MPNIDIQDPEYQSLLVENTLDILANLRDSTGMTSAVAMLSKSKTEGIVLASLGGSSDHCYVPRVGSHFQLHATAPGKALLASQPRAERRRIANLIEYTPFTSKTVSNTEDFITLLKKENAQGFSTDVGEYVDGVNCAASCVHAPDGTPLAAVWITALSIDLPTNRLGEFTQTVLRAAKDMELRLQNAQEDPNFHANVIVEEAKKFIELHYVNAEKIQDYFDGLSLSYSWFRKLFRDKYGIAPMKYRQELLHERARKLISKTNLSIKEIAFQLNYETQNYFSRAFKNQEGVSPIQYRERYRTGG
ncbi:IclR family transcriptional regulator C-terminal domain-containing protein [Pelagicoccus sp. SDUM812005]|uniref:IclR family transcriptional regulator domain-containing protein n=1 Tax=Pelagicoccus sp. SDUM812005 TaxID=3041257 RepID=UPI00280E09B7|nr:IclR family transcriptional regulator C-terminal domain-containing protein [Pelagicoccus sp. SDUM812005]MDQ8180294.1 IclR family transcriptional regulator C-terminal domain-containing protein [Pelagicoccus sp. SDUM812005]